MVYQDFPKANSHVHANGMATDYDVRCLARKYDVDLSQLKHIEADGSRKWAEDHHSVSHHAYDETVSLIRTPEDLRNVVYGGLILDAQLGCIYTRLLSSGLNNCRNNNFISVFAQNMLAIAAAISEARHVTGIETTVSISIKRHLKDGPMQAHRLLDACEHFQKKYPDEAQMITGLDMAGNEENASPKDFYDVFERATQSQARWGLGLAGSCHAGEVSPVDDVWEALRLPGIKQISHALSAIHDSLLMEEIRQREILIDQLPVSNAMLHDDRLTPHPLPIFLAYKCLVALGSDDPGIQQTFIDDDYRAAERLGVSEANLLNCTANAIRYGFMPDETKKKLLKRIDIYAHKKDFQRVGLASFSRRPGQSFEAGSYI